MKKNILIIFAFTFTFALGLSFNSLINAASNNPQPIKKVTGIGGIFFKCKDPKKMREWYKNKFRFKYK